MHGRDEPDQTEKMIAMQMGDERMAKPAGLYPEKLHLQLRAFAAIQKVIAVMIV